MDPGTLIGVFLAFAAILVGMVMEGGEPMSIILIPALIIVFGGTFGAAMAGNGMTRFLAGFKQIGRAFTAKKVSSDDTVRTLIGFAERARRDGLLALEETARTIDDPFLRKGIELAVDGTDPDELRDILETEIDAKREADKAGTKVFTDMGGYGPTFGIIGTVMGLIHVLENLSEPEELGHLIAGAFVATLWGVLSANALWYPVAKRLQLVSDAQVRQMELLVEGVMSIQSGANPRVIEQKLISFLPAAERAAFVSDEAA